MTTKTKTTCVRDKASAKAWRTMPVTDLFDKLPVGKRYDQRTVFPYGKVPVIDQGKSGVIGYHNEEPGIRASEEKPIVTFANHTCQVTLQKRNFSVIQNVFPLKAKEGVDPWFLYYRIRDAIKFQEYKGHWPDFVMLQFLVPPHNEQKRIAEVLSAFDEKIENNNRIIKALDETAQAIFKEWFVKFRFPGYEKVEFVDSELSKIPKGWEAKGVLDVVERISVGKKFENKTALPNGKVPILDQGQSGFIGYHNEEPGVMASTDKPVIVFTNHTCYYRLVTYPFSAIQNVLPYVGANGFPTLFVYYLTKDKIKMQEYKGHWPEFEQQEFVVPPPILAEEYTNFIKPMVQEIAEAENENKKLAAMRDLLLPRLMSGEIRV
ncbi:MAG TPA: restriction endonuclease subunit S [Candidatus Paceibacterota bacterium]|uniref:Type I restriction modification DNA specificity domain-containing protein n=1 Tax=Candidatus Lloydbacteria bacterium RIFCSPLOWO2_02_FULL_51_11 TaxID=1798667 RepID=A0A1G2DM14_9BACT|nr:MAG: hypothetical protein A3J08_03305 [Candidatus Lloydbacteria bacterium RIFCSPLOWO2_02_FULL_51_11]